MLEVVSHPQARAQLRFVSLARHDADACCIGLLHNSSGYRLRAPIIEVVPERGDSRAPAQLTIAGKLPRRIVSLPGPVLKGFAKSVVQASTDLGSAANPPDRWKAALTLALDGELPVSPQGTTPGGRNAVAFSKQDGRLVWQPFVARLAGELTGLAGKLAERNPFADGLTQSAAARLLDTGNRRMAGLALERAAADNGWEQTWRLGETLYQLRGPSAAGPDADDEAAAQKIYEAVEQGEGGLAQLRTKFRARPHVLPWLLEAGRLVCSADGFLFTQNELSSYWRELELGDQAEVPGVGEIKERLGLKRRKAEGLRRLLSDHRGATTQGRSAGAGQ
jgi:hypothetical protein